MGPNLTSRADRARHVARMLTNFRLEGIEPDAADQLLLQEYIEGRINLDTLLAYAHQFSTALQKFNDLT